MILVLPGEASIFQRLLRGDHCDLAGQGHEPRAGPWKERVGIESLKLSADMT